MMSTIAKSITVRVHPEIIYRALKDTRLERIFPEFFIGVTRIIKTDKVDSELKICTITEDSQIEVNETFRLRISGGSNTDVGYITQTNDIFYPVGQSISWIFYVDIVRDVITD